jgi:integrase
MTATYHYRCERHFDRLIRWLRSKGVTASNPLHTLRKEFGSQIAAQAGIFAASMALRHADIQLTRDYYVDKKRRTVFKVGKLLHLTKPASQKPAPPANDVDQTDEAA